MLQIVKVLLKQLVSAEDGQKIWTVNLAKKDGWLLHVLSFLSGGVTAYKDAIYLGSEKHKSMHLIPMMAPLYCMESKCCR